MLHLWVYQWIGIEFVFALFSIKGYVCWLPATDSMTSYMTDFWVFLIDMSSKSDRGLWAGSYSRQEAKSSSDLITQLFCWTAAWCSQEWALHALWRSSWRWTVEELCLLSVDRCLQMSYTISSAYLLHCYCSNFSCRITVYRVATHNTSC